MKKDERYNYYDIDEEVENEYMTPKEVMNLLYIGKNTFYRLVNTGELPAFRIGKLWRVRKKDLKKYCCAVSQKKYESQ